MITEERQPGHGSRPELKDLKNMSEMEFYKSSHRETEYGIFFIDPATGEELPLDRLPDFLAQEKDLNDGYEFLKMFNEKFNLEVFFAPHYENAPEQLDYFESKVNESDIVLFEGVSWADKDRKMLNDLSFSRGDIDRNVLRDYTIYINSAGQQEYGDTTQTQKLTAINKSKKHISFFDIKKLDNNNPDDDKFGIRRQILGTHKMTERMKKLNVTDKPNPAEAKIDLDTDIDAQIICSEAMREWYMTAATGHEIGELCQKNSELLEKLKAGNLKVLMLVGASHGDLVRKFKTAGVEVKFTAPTRTEEESKSANGQMPKWIAQGFIDKEELRRFNTPTT